MYVYIYISECISVFASMLLYGLVIVFMVLVILQLPIL